ncbi:glycerophosphodiester phosphodiesterase [Cohnella nanjingensis]|uniref:Glycerophosphodiester phosphodiesterase n=1 Tax=Cohnella nanjingensis TaxID=1387779 RepID=A0A7X0RRN6_9BACL|nr:glycerophosphodiester phosphodiesterase [Cohnella nanjingensis]MBB6671175.1 glycerophosphodiester phosphodiesterase [Cohnella nanjingensis]
MNDFPLITAHTGCMGTLDNSLLSARTALALGADIVEDDIRATRDGALVLSHDDRVPLADGRDGSVSSLTLAELNDGAAEPLVPLEPVLGMVRDAGRRMNLDLKDDACLEPVARLIGRLEMTDRVFLSGCGYGRALAAARIVPHLRKLLNVDVQPFLSAIGVEAGLHAAAEACEQALSAGCFGLNVPYPLAREELIALAAEKGLDVYVWTVNDTEGMRRCVDLGVRSITTRNVEALVRLRADRARPEAGE